MLGWSKSGAFRSVYAQALDWLFPPRCAGCKQLGSHWCSSCQNNVGRIEEPFCKTCGLPLTAEEECFTCLHERFSFDAARSWARYDGNLRQAILSLKHRRNETLAAQLANSLADVVESDWEADLLVPVPLAPQRLAQRGYNQSELLATALGGLLGLPVSTVALKRPHETLPQVGLNPSQRRKNMRGAFTVDPSNVGGKVVLVLDDIMTTGATLDAAARALKEDGAKNVFALSLARTMLEHDWGFW